MKKGIKQKIVDLLQEREYSPRDLQETLGVSASLVQRHLKDLRAGGFVERMGRAPRVSYRLVKKPSVVIKSPLIEKHFIFKDYAGNIYYGLDGFLKWSEDNLKKYSLEEKITLYERYVRELQDVRKESPVFSLAGKLDEFHKKTGETVYLRDVVCAVPYAFPDFGKTKESILLSIAKEGGSQSRGFCDQLISAFLPILSEYVRQEAFDAVAFVPPSASRRVQLMHLLRKRFSAVSDLPIIDVRKQHGRVVQQQKHISNIMNRLKNADSTLYIRPASKGYTKVLLIDDFVGSGATLNQIAKKLIRQGAAEVVYGIGIVGVRKGFVVEKKV